MVPILANALVEVTGNDQGGHVIVDPPIAIGALYLFLLLLPLLFILLYLFYRKNLQHKQILAAMDKGVPISELIAKPQGPDRAINWVRSLSLGIGLLFIGIALTAFMLMTHAEPPLVVIPIVVGGFGLTFLLRGILQKNIEKNKDK